MKAVNLPLDQYATISFHAGVSVPQVLAETGEKGALALTAVEAVSVSPRPPDSSPSILHEPVNLVNKDARPSLVLLAQVVERFEVADQGSAARLFVSELGGEVGSFEVGELVEGLCRWICRIGSLHCRV